MHRDIKPENILLASGDPDCTNIKICDFGLAKVIEPRAGSSLSPRSARKSVQGGGVQPSMTTRVGTEGYQAPEVMVGRPYSYSADLWSLGVVLYVFSNVLYPSYSIFYTLYTPFIAVHTPMSTRYACIYTIYTPYKHLTPPPKHPLYTLNTHHYMVHGTWYRYIMLQGRPPYNDKDYVPNEDRAYIPRGYPKFYDEDWVGLDGEAQVRLSELCRHLKPQT
jgi:serine/threonine protein kinase